MTILPLQTFFVLPFSLLNSSIQLSISHAVFLSSNFAYKSLNRPSLLPPVIHIKSLFLLPTYAYSTLVNIEVEEQFTGKFEKYNLILHHNCLSLMRPFLLIDSNITFTQRRPIIVQLFFMNYIKLQYAITVNDYWVYVELIFEIS